MNAKRGFFFGLCTDFLKAQIRCGRFDMLFFWCDFGLSSICGVKVMKRILPNAGYNNNHFNRDRNGQNGIFFIFVVDSSNMTTIPIQTTQNQQEMFG